MGLHLRYEVIQGSITSQGSNTTRIDRLCRANTYFINKAVPFSLFKGTA